MIIIALRELSNLSREWLNKRAKQKEESLLERELDSASEMIRLAEGNNTDKIDSVYEAIHYVGDFLELAKRSKHKYIYNCERAKQIVWDKMHKQLNDEENFRQELEELIDKQVWGYEPMEKLIKKKLGMTREQVVEYMMFNIESEVKEKQRIGTAENELNIVYLENKREEFDDNKVYADLVSK